MRSLPLCFSFLHSGKFISLYDPCALDSDCDDEFFNSLPARYGHEALAGGALNINSTCNCGASGRKLWCTATCLSLACHRRNEGVVMKYDFLVETYETEQVKVLSVWSEFRDEDLPVRPKQSDPRGRSVQEQMVHQCVMRRFILSRPFPVSILGASACYLKWFVRTDSRNNPHVVGRVDREICTRCEWRQEGRALNQYTLNRVHHSFQVARSV